MGKASAVQKYCIPQYYIGIVSYNMRYGINIDF